MSKTSILLVEDELDIREPLIELFEEEGYRPYAASNGKEALKLLADMPKPSIILCDLMMPEMSGSDFINAVRAQPEGQKDMFSIVVFSAASSGLATAKSLGVDFLKKPIDLNEMLDLLNQKREELKTKV